MRTVDLAAIPGDRVTIPDMHSGDGVAARAIVNAVSLGNASVMYEVRYWHNGVAVLAWLTSKEIVPEPARASAPPSEIQKQWRWLGNADELPAWLRDRLRRLVMQPDALKPGEVMTMNNLLYLRSAEEVEVAEAGDMVVLMENGNLGVVK